MRCKITQKKSHAKIVACDFLESFLKVSLPLFKRVFVHEKLLQFHYAFRFRNQVRGRLDPVLMIIGQNVRNSLLAPMYDSSYGRYLIAHVPQHRYEHAPGHAHVFTLAFA